MKPISKTIKITAIALFLTVLTLAYGCQPKDKLADNQPQTAQVAIKSTSDPSKVMGEVNFSLTEEGMLIEATINDAPPGKHGFHIHEIGSCEDGGKAAGGHFNPDGVKHGLLVRDGFENAHAGDLGNIEVSSDGTATKTETFLGLNFNAEQYAIEGLSVILHADEDDFGQPTGNAGGRIGCGVIAMSGS